jgi:hypothetical protein
MLVLRIFGVKTAQKRRPQIPRTFLAMFIFESRFGNLKIVVFFLGAKSKVVDP